MNLCQENNSARLPATFATATTLNTQALDVRGWSHIAIEFATFGSALSVDSTCAYVQGVAGGGYQTAASAAASATFRRIQDEGAYSAGVKLADWEVPSFEGNRMVICRPAARFDFIKVELNNATTHTFGCWLDLHN